VLQIDFNTTRKLKGHSLTTTIRDSVRREQNTNRKPRTAPERDGSCRNLPPLT
jgi:hypothetical protein